MRTPLPKLHATVRRLSLLSALVVVLSCCASADAESVYPPPAHPNGNRIVGGQGESLAAWSGSGFVVDPSWHAAFPAPFWGFFPGEPSGPVFEAETGGASIAQTDSLADLASSIDTGTQRLWAAGDFGGSSAEPDGTYMTVQLLNASGETVGSPAQFGPASPVDRLNSTAMVRCQGAIAVPPGVRAARVTLNAEEPTGEPSTGTADTLGLWTEPPAYPGAGFSPPTTPGTYIRMDESGGQGPGCGHAEPFTIAASGIEPSHASPESPSSPVRVTTIRVRNVALSRSSLTLQVSAAGVIAVTISPLRYRTGYRYSRATPAEIKLTLAAHSAGEMTHRFKHKLAPGHYQLQITATGTTGLVETVSRDALVR